MTELDDDGRREPPLAAGEADTLFGFLNFLRDTIEWKCSGVDAAGMRHRLAPSTMTLGGLLRHLAYVEDNWAIEWVAGLDRPEPWASVDWESDQDWEWNTAHELSPDELLESWRVSVERAQQHLDAAIADRGLDGGIARPRTDGRPMTIRWVVVHLIEEYGRHCGHADLLREAIDGSTGE